MRCQVSPLFVIIMIVLVGRYCYWFRVTIWNGESGAYPAVPEPAAYADRVYLAETQHRCHSMSECMRVDMRQALVP